MNDFDDRWHRLAALSRAHPTPAAPEPPLHLASRAVRGVPRPIIPWPFAVAVAACLNAAALLALPGAWSTLSSHRADSLSSLIHLPVLPALPTLLRLRFAPLQDHP